MKTRILIIVICVAVIALSVWNNARYSSANQETERVEKQQDSICMLRYENLLHSIQTDTQIIDSLVQGHKYVDSVYLKNQEHLLQQMDFLISINKQILKQNQKPKCSNSSITHTAE